MKKRIVVKVTAEHIKKGKRRDAHCCPLALALKEKAPGFVSVGDDDCSVGAREYNLSPKAKKFVKTIDRNKSKTAPATFILTEKDICDYAKF